MESEFFERIYDDLVPGEWIELRLLNAENGKKGAFQCSFFPDLSTFLQRLKELKSYPGQMFFGVAPRSSKPTDLKKGAGKERVTSTSVLWADIDHVAELNPTSPPPTFTVSSGHGFHLYWKLQERLKASEAEELMKRLAKSVKGDPVWDASRILRVPGSMNRKARPPVKCVVVQDTSLVYTTSDIEAGLRVDNKTVSWMHTEGHAGFPSRSERDWSVISGMVRAGWSDEGIYSTLCALPSGDRIRDPQKGRQYFDRTLEKVKASKKTQKSPEGEELTEFATKGNQYVDPASGGAYSTFTFTPRALIEHNHSNEGTGVQQDCLVGDLRTDQGIWPEVVLSKRAFNSTHDLLNEMPQASAQWLGGDRTLRALLPFLVKGELKKIRATTCLGRSGKEWVGSSEVVREDDVVTGMDREVLFLDRGREHLQTSYPVLSHSKLKDLSRCVFQDLWGINRPSVVYSVLGWLYACPFKTILWSKNLRFPILNITGTRGSGKTATITRVLLPLLGISDSRSFDSGTTPFVLLSLLGSSNSLPVSLAEYRVSSGARLTRYLLLSYDSSRDSRGRPDQTTQTYPLTAPIIVDGEDALSEPALKERTVQVRVEPETIARGGIAHKAFESLSRRDLLPLGTSYLQYTLHAPDRYAEAKKIVNHVLKKEIVPDRVFHNMVVVVLGCLHLQTWLEQFEVKVPWTDYEWILETLHNVVEPSGRTALLVDEFVEALVNDYVTLNGHRPYVAAYNAEENTLGFQLTSAYSWWVSSRRSQGRATLDLPAMKAQLEEREFDPERPKKGQYMLRAKATELEGKTRWIRKINLKAASDSGLDVPPRLDRAATQIALGGNSK